MASTLAEWVRREEAWEDREGSFRARHVSPLSALDCMLERAAESKTQLHSSNSTLWPGRGWE